MRKCRVFFATILFLFSFILFNSVKAQITVFEKTDGKETATYFEVIEYYQSLAAKNPMIQIKTMGLTDAGYPLHLVLVSGDKKFDPVQWHKENKIVILVNNGIHAGEPDGIDASMMLVRDIINKKVSLPQNVALAFIPVYNIGGSLNRTPYSRVSQDGPAAYGFRGNAQNLDLNRDFTKNDSKNARSFIEIFHFLDPDILIDNHVSDGADYQHTITLISTQYNKQGEALGQWVKNNFDPLLYQGMKKKNWDMVRYVNVDGADPFVGFSQFYDAPRYSSGFATLFHTLAYMPETHMLKPYKPRVLSTYALMQTFIEESSKKANEIIAERKKAKAATLAQKQFPLSWKLDTSRYSMIPFMGYEAGTRPSKATGLPIRFYDHNKPIQKEVKFFDTYIAQNIVTKPKAYVIPQGWWAVTDILKLNGVKMNRLQKDSTIEVTVTHITGNKPYPIAYEKHHKNAQVTTEISKDKIKFLKGDYIIYLDQKANRYLVEMLEPTGDDSFFAWNFFDGIFQQKEGYSDYRWDSIAADYLNKNPDLKAKMNQMIKEDSVFAKNSRAQLSFIYKNSPWAEPSYLRYPVFRIEN